MDLEIIKADKTAARRTAPRSAKVDLEIILEQHREWVKSSGDTGRQADLSRLNLEGADLTDTNLRNALLNETVLKGADLLLTDLQGASLLQANLEGTNLLGARLREANLQGAVLEGATGLMAAELAGSNLTFAKLPAEVATRDDLKSISRRGRHANWLVGALLLLNALACLRVVTVSDAQILRNAALLPFPMLRNAVPLAQFFLLCPVVIGALYLWVGVYLQRLWEATAAAIHFPHSAARAFRSDDSGLFSGPQAELAPPATVSAGEELAEPPGLLANPAIGSGTQPHRAPEKKSIPLRIPIGAGFGLILCLLSIGTIDGVPHNGNPGQGIGSGSPWTWAANALWVFGYDPYAQVTEAEISRKPAGWTGSEGEISRVQGASLNGLRLRYLQAYSAFLVKARLRKADLSYAYLSEADLRQANLRQASLRSAALDQAKLNGAMLQSSDLEKANMIRAELEKADLSFASLAGALLLDAKLDNAVLYGADLRNAWLDRASL